MQDVSIQEALFHLGLRWDFSRQDFERARNEARDERAYVWWEMVLPYAIARARVWSDEEPAEVIALDDDYEIAIELDVDDFADFEADEAPQACTSLAEWAVRHLDGVEQGIVKHQPTMDLSLLASLVRHHDAGAELLELWVEESLVQPGLRDSRAFVHLAALMGSRRKMGVFRRVISRYAEFARRTTCEHWGERVARELHIAQRRFHVGVLIQLCDGLVDPLLSAEFEGFVATDEELDDLIRYCPELSYRLGLVDVGPTPELARGLVIFVLVCIAAALGVAAMNL